MDCLTDVMLSLCTCRDRIGLFWSDLSDHPHLSQAQVITANEHSKGCVYRLCGKGRLCTVDWTRDWAVGLDSENVSILCCTERVYIAEE